MISESLNQEIDPNVNSVWLSSGWRTFALKSDTQTTVFNIWKCMFKIQWIYFNSSTGSTADLKIQKRRHETQICSGLREINFTRICDKTFGTFHLIMTKRLSCRSKRNHKSLKVCGWLLRQLWWREGPRFPCRPPPWQEPLSPSGWGSWGSQTCVASWCSQTGTHGQHAEGAPRQGKR